MKNIDNTETISSLNEILKYELAGVVKYTHFALMVTGQIDCLDKFFKEQAEESLEHTQQAGVVNRIRRASITSDSRD